MQSIKPESNPGQIENEGGCYVEIGGQNVLQNFEQNQSTIEQLQHEQRIKISAQEGEQAIDKEIAEQDKQKDSNHQIYEVIQKTLPILNVQMNQINSNIDKDEQFLNNMKINNSNMDSEMKADNQAQPSSVEEEKAQSGQKEGETKMEQSSQNQRLSVDKEQNSSKHEEVEPEDDIVHHINANVYQMAIINKMLPKGYKFDIYDTVRRQMDIHLKKTSGLANYMIAKPEILNEKKQQKIMQKYNQKRLKEQQKLRQQQFHIIQEQMQMMENGNPSTLKNNDQTTAHLNNQYNAGKGSKQQNNSKDSGKLKKQNSKNQINQSKQMDINLQSKIGGDYKDNADHTSQLNNNIGGNFQYHRQSSSNNLTKNNAKKVGKKRGAADLLNENQIKIDLNDEPVENSDEYKKDKNIHHISSQQINTNFLEKQEIESLNKLKMMANMNGGNSNSIIANGKGSGTGPKDQYNQQANNSINWNEGKLDKKGKKIKRNYEKDAGANEKEMIEESKVSKTKYSGAKMNDHYEDEINQNDQMKNQIMDGNDKNYDLDPDEIKIKPGQQSRLFSNVDRETFSIYEKYYRLLESLVNHEELQNLSETPLFLRRPNEQTKGYKQIAQENNGLGYLNFHLIFQRLKAKKYGPGKKMIKEDVLQSDIRSVFRICRKYFSHDPISMKVCKSLQIFFETELILSPHVEFQHFKQLSKKNDQNLKDSQLKKGDSHNPGKQAKSTFEGKGKSKKVEDDDQNMKSSVAAGDKKSKGDDSNPETKKHKEEVADKKKKEKKEKKEKKDKKEKKSKEQNDDDPEDDIKQRLYEKIMNHLNVEQKKGIIPIVFNMNMDDTKNQIMLKQKFEFDLFSLPSKKFKRLEAYVQECIEKNQAAKLAKDQNKGQNQQAQNGSNDQNLIYNQIQNQIDEKFRENKMDVGDGYDKKTSDNKQAVAKDVQQTRQPKLYDINDQSPYEEDRRTLIEKINQLNTEQLRGIVPIVKLFQTADQQNDEKKLEFDLFELPNIKCKELHNYVEKCLLENQTAQEKQVQQKLISDQMNVLMEQQKSSQNQDTLNEQIKYQQQLQQQIYGYDNQDNIVDQNQELLQQQAALQAQMQQQQQLQQQQQQHQQQQEQQHPYVDPALPHQNQTQSNQQSQQMDEAQQQEAMIKQQQQLQMLQQQSQMVGGMDEMQQQQQQQQQLLMMAMKGDMNAQQQVQQQNQRMQMMGGNEMEQQQNDQDSKQNAHQLKLQLVNLINMLDQEKLNLLGLLINSPEYLSLDGDQDVNKDKVLNIQRDPKTGQKSIEIDIQMLSLKKVKYLINFLQNQQNPDAQINQLQPEQQMEAPADENDQQIQMLLQQVNAYDPELFEKSVQQTKLQQEEIESQYVEFQNQIQLQFDHNKQQLHQVQKLIQQLSTQQMPNMDPSQDEQLQQQLQNEALIRQNLQQLMNYQAQQKQICENKLQALMLEDEQRQAMNRKYNQMKEQLILLVGRQLSEKERRMALKQQTEGQGQVDVQQQAIDENAKKQQEQPKMMGPAQQTQMNEAITENKISSQTPETMQANNMDLQQKPQVQEQQQNIIDIQNKENQPQNDELAGQKPDPETNYQAAPINPQPAPEGATAANIQSKIQVQLDKLLYEYQVVTSDLEQQMQLSEQFEQIFMQIQNQGGIPPNQIQQIQAQHMETQTQISHLVQLQYYYQQQINQLQQTGFVDQDQQQQISQQVQQQVQAQPQQQPQGGFPVHQQQPMGEEKGAAQQEQQAIGPQATSNSQVPTQTDQQSLQMQQQPTFNGRAQFEEMQADPNAAMQQAQQQMGQPQTATSQMPQQHPSNPHHQQPIGENPAWVSKFVGFMQGQPQSEQLPRQQQPQQQFVGQPQQDEAAARIGQQQAMTQQQQPPQ